MPSGGDVPGKTCPTWWWSVSPAGTSSQASTPYQTHWSTCCSRCRQIELPCTALLQHVNMVRLVGVPYRTCAVQDLSDHGVVGLVLGLSRTARYILAHEVQGLVSLGGHSLNVFTPVQVLSYFHTQIGMISIVFELELFSMEYSAVTCFFLVMESTEHFSGLKFTCQWHGHRRSWSRSRRRSVVSWWSLMCLYIRQSSANNLMLELVFLLMLLMYNINIRRPKIVPWGTHDLTAASLEHTPSTTTLCNRPGSQCLL